MYISINTRSRCHCSILSVARLDPELMNYLVMQLRDSSIIFMFMCKLFTIYETDHVVPNNRTVVSRDRGFTSIHLLDA